MQDEEFTAPLKPQPTKESTKLINDFAKQNVGGIGEENIQIEERSFEKNNSESESILNSTPKNNSNKITKQNNSDIRRTLGFGALFFITINAIFGSSLTYLPGLGVQMTGPSSILMWVGVFLIGLYIALCLSELISLFPEKGNIYKFAKSAFGHFTGFLVGWTSWFTGNIVASLSIVWALEYLFPMAGTTAYLIKLGVGVLVVFLFNLIVFYGMNLSTVILVSFSIITLGFLTTQILPLFINIQTLISKGTLISPFDIHRFKPFFIHQGLGTNMIFLFGALFLISEAFMGLSGITYLSQDTKKPEKNLPKAIISAMLFVGGLSLIYVFGSIGVLPFDKYITSALPHKDLLLMVWSGSMRIISLAGTGVIILAPAITWVVTGPRLLASMAQDKLFLEQHAHIHKKWKTPHVAIRFQTLIISAFVVIFYFLYLKGFSDPYKLIHEVFLIMVFFMLSLVVLSVPKLRKTMPLAKRKWKTPGGRFGPYILVLVLIIITLAYVIPTHEINIIFKAFSLIFVAIPIYLLLILYYNPDATIKAYSSLSILTKYLENFILPKRIIKKILKQLDDLQGKIVFEYGSSVGTLTLKLAKATGPQGLVHAVDFTPKNTNLLQKRLNKKNYTHVRAIYDEFMVSRVHPSINQADIVVSVGMLDHVQNLEKLLEDMAFILPDEGKVLFVEYSDFFGVLPNSGWISDFDRLKDIFRKAGFAVEIIKWKGFLWNYVAIYGIKTNEDIVMI